MVAVLVGSKDAVKTKKNKKGETSSKWTPRIWMRTSLFFDSFFLVVICSRVIMIVMSVVMEMIMAVVMRVIMGMRIAVIMGSDHLRE